MIPTKSFKVIVRLNALAGFEFDESPYIVEVLILVIFYVDILL